MTDPARHTPEAERGHDAGATLHLDHARFGVLDVPAAKVLHVDGLPGFDHVRRVAVVEHDTPSPFAWLVSLDDRDLAFVVTDPRLAFPDYAPALEKRHRRAIGQQEDQEQEPIELLAIVSLGGDAPTLNLAAPIVVNPRTRQATQAILDGDRHPLRAPLAITPAPQAGAEAPQVGERAPDAGQIESKPQR